MSNQGMGATLESVVVFLPAGLRSRGVLPAMFFLFARLPYEILWGRRFPARRLPKKSAELDGGKEDSVKGTQEGFLSRAIARPQATDFG